MNSTLKHIIFSILLTLSSSLVAQIHVPLLCGFEDSENLSDWHLNVGTPNAPDKWYVGRATRSDGRKALYISSDGGQNATYSGKPNIVMAYRSIVFPVSNQREEYEISFDWKCMGEGSKAALYVYVGAASQLADIPVSETTDRLLSNAFVNSCKLVGNRTTKYISGSEAWENASITVPFAISRAASQARTEIVLAFIWVSGLSDEAAETPRLSACIDNVQIASNRAKKPINLSVRPHCEDSTIIVDWESTLSQFTIEYKNVNATYWRIISGVNDNGLTHSFPIPQLREGAYKIRVRGMRENDNAPADTSAYTYSSQVVLYCPENHCINFIDLENPNTTCTYGTASNPFLNTGIVNWGSDSRESRHTVNYDQSEYDPRTNDLLSVIPQGEMASVRLGNWLAGGEGESITYTFIADTVDQAILLLNYAVVLEDPNHEVEEQPYFSLEILDQNGNLINPTCGAASFYAGHGDGVWYTVENSEVTWKDWTSIGLHIDPKYHGQTLRVRLQTRDCTLSGHYGYAYFTIDCVSAKLMSNSCGNDASISVEAPEGFLYHWTDDTGKDYGTNREIDVAADRHTYFCEACYKENDGCCFTLSTDMAPRFPVADFEYRWTPTKCHNNVTLINKSHVVLRESNREIHTSETCESYEWFFSNGTNTAVPSPVLTCKSEGDTIVATLKAMMSEGACDTTYTATIIVPSILSAPSTMFEEKCEGEAIFFDNEWRTTTGLYAENNKNCYGCDSIIYLDLTVHPVSPETYLVDTACSSDIYMFGGIRRTESNEDYQYWAKNQWGCDSIVHLNLTVIEKLVVDPTTQPILCADDKQLTIDYSVLSGSFQLLLVRFSNNAQKVGFKNSTITDQTLTSLVYDYGVETAPDYYWVELEFVQAGCENQIFHLPFEIHYSSSIVEQKWDDVLYATNAENNGGYTFVAYQWYKNGEPIEGATSSYYYAYNDNGLDPNATYSVLLTRDDGVTITTCPIYADPHKVPTDISDIPFDLIIPSYLHSSDIVQINLPNDATLTIYDLAGKICQTYHCTAGTNALTMPSVQGTYLMHIIYSNDQYDSRKIILY